MNCLIAKTSATKNSDNDESPGTFPKEVDYGYKYCEKAVTKKVGDIRFNGKQAVTTYPGTEWTRSVLAYGSKDREYSYCYIDRKGSDRTLMEIYRTKK